MSDKAWIKSTVGLCNACESGKVIKRTLSKTTTATRNSDFRMECSNIQDLDDVLASKSPHFFKARIALPNNFKNEMIASCFSTHLVSYSCTNCFFLVCGA